MPNNSILELANEVTQLIERHDNRTEEFCAALSTEQAARDLLSEVQADLATVESELIADAAVSAKVAKEGPLASIAVSDTKARNAAITKLCSSDKGCAKLTDEVRRIKSALENAAIASEQAKARMRGATAILDAKTIILAALGNVNC